MKFTSYLYIFALTVLCSPRFLIKDKSPNYILYSIIFTLVLYITFDFVNKYTENYEQYNVDVKGVDSLVDLIKPQGGTNEPNKIDINNQLFQEAGADDANCWNAFGKNKKELEIIKVQLDSYAGSKESIDKLNNQLDSQKEEIDKLQDELKGFEGTVTEIDQINIQIKKYQGEIDKLQQQLVLYNQTSETIGEVNNQIAKIESIITDLNTKISVCNTLNGRKEQNIANLTEQISGQGATITSLERKKTDLTNFIASQKDKIASLEKTIKDKTGCPSPVYAIGTANVDPWYIGNKRNGAIFGQRSAYWIWWTSNARISAPSNGKHYIYYYNNPGDSYVSLYVTADNYFKLHVNENYIGEDGSWDIIQGYTIKLKTGRNKFDFYARNFGDNNPAGLIVVGIRPNGQTAFVSAPSTVDSGWSYY